MSRDRQVKTDIDYFFSAGMMRPKQSVQFFRLHPVSLLPTNHWSAWCFGPVSEEREVGLAAALHSLRCWHVWRSGSVCDDETKCGSVLGHHAAAVAAAAGAQGEEVGGVPCHPWFPQAPS